MITYQLKAQGNVASSLSYQKKTEEMWVLVLAPSASAVKL